MRDHSLRRWAVACAVMAPILAVALAYLTAHDVVLCTTTLGTVAEPSAWRTWPVLPDLGGYRIEGRSLCTGRAPSCGMADTELRDDRLCPRGGVSVDAWFAADMYGLPGDITLRASGQTLVASAYSLLRSGRSGPHTPEDEQFIVAFQRVRSASRPAYAHTSVEAIAGALSVALLGLVVGAILARRDVIRARAYLDPARFGTREPPERDAGALAAARHARAARSLKRALLGGVGVVLLVQLLEACREMREWSIGV